MELRPIEVKPVSASMKSWAVNEKVWKGVRSMEITKDWVPVIGDQVENGSET